eukprot:TRINITY_DN92357_c0_g1_i1.p4 TRINITY_DN92357_c0_g1~~TRINITY_DN92357_c0_g1_i1.p4  ORF type:complete len:136 (-),score=10.57 TRINITY_DN92357_c0_g1_i1:499-906(-)
MKMLFDAIEKAKPLDKESLLKAEKHRNENIIKCAKRLILNEERIVQEYHARIKFEPDGSSIVNTLAVIGPVSGTAGVIGNSIAAESAATTAVAGVTGAVTGAPVAAISSVGVGFLAAGAVAVGGYLSIKLIHRFF